MTQDDADIIKELMRVTGDAFKSIETRLSKLEAQITRLDEFAESGFSDMSEEMIELQNKLDESQDQIKSLVSQG